MEAREDIMKRFSTPLAVASFLALVALAVYSNTVSALVS
jgi:hypothetical protein